MDWERIENVCAFHLSFSFFFSLAAYFMDFTVLLKLILASFFISLIVVVRLFRWKRCEILISTKWWDFGMLLSIIHRLRRPPNILAWNVISRCPKKLLWLVWFNGHLCYTRTHRHSSFISSIFIYTVHKMWSPNLQQDVFVVFFLLGHNEIHIFVQGWPWYGYYWR